MPPLIARLRAPWPKQVFLIGSVLSWVAVAAVAQNGPYANAQDRTAGETAAQQSTASGPGDLVRNQVVQKLRMAMSGVGIDDPGVQNSLLEFFKQDEIGKRKVRQSANRLAYALRSNANPDLIAQVMKEYKDCLDSDKGRREQAQKSLDGQIGYSEKPRLEAILLLMGVLGDGSTFVSASLLAPRPNTVTSAVNNQGQMDQGGEPGRLAPGLGTNGLLPSANNSAVLGERSPFGNQSPRNRVGTGANGVTDNNPFGALRNNDTRNLAPVARPANDHSGAATNVPEIPPAPATSTDTRTTNGTSTGTPPPPRPLPPSPKGTVVGTVDKKGAEWIDIRADDGTVERYFPAWRGGAQGGFDPKIVQTIQDLGIGDKVQADWEFNERKRIYKLSPVAGEHKN